MVYDKKEAKKLAQEIKVEFNLGKNGITDTFLASVDKFLKAHSIVKIKCSLAANKDELAYFAGEVSKQLSAELVEKKGYTFTIFKEKWD